MCEFAVEFGIFRLLPFILSLIVYIILWKIKIIKYINEYLYNVINNIDNKLPSFVKTVISFVTGISVALINKETGITLVIVAVVFSIFYLLKKTTFAIALSISIVLLSVCINIQDINDFKNNIILNKCHKNKFKVLYCVYPIDDKVFMDNPYRISINSYLKNMENESGDRYDDRVFQNSRNINYSVCKVKPIELLDNIKGIYNLSIYGERNRDNIAISMVLPVNKHSEFYGPSFKTAIFSVGQEEIASNNQDNTEYYYDRFFCTIYEHSLNNYENNVKGIEHPPFIVDNEDPNSIRICIDTANFYRINGMQDSVIKYLELSYTLQQQLNDEMPLPWDYFYEYAWYYFNERNFNEAEDYFNYAIDVYVESYGHSMIYYELIYTLGVYYLYTDNYSGYINAINQYNVCLNNNYSHYELFNNYGLALIKINKYDCAVDTLIIAEKINQDCCIVKSNLYRAQIEKCISADERCMISSNIINKYENIGEERPEIYFYLAILFENRNMTYIDEKYTVINYLQIFCDKSNNFTKLDKNVLPSDVEEMMVKCLEYGIKCQ